MKNKEKRHTALTLRERIDIEQQYKYGAGISHIARYIGRNKSTISRELKGKTPIGIRKYQADVAHRKALDRIAKRGNSALLDKNKQLYNYVVEKLKLGWSPEQISIRLPIDHKKDKDMRISYEAIYQYAYSKARVGSNEKMKEGCFDLRPLLPRKRKRRGTKGARMAQKLERRASLPSIEDRPRIVEKRARIGDWEDDTLVSRQSKARIKSVNERKIGVVFFTRTANGTANSCDEALRKKLKGIPKEYRLTLTRDRGSENMNHENLAEDLEMDIFFTHPYCSHERGSNENANGLFRRYFPKKTDFDRITDEEIERVEYLINTRPRKRLGGLTPAEVFYRETGVALFS